jgi:ribonuclease HI
MKDYEKIGNCNDTHCKYFDESMELNCSYSEDNSKCIETVKENEGVISLLEKIKNLKIENSNLKKQNKELREALSWFCNRVDTGEVRSKRTYARFKELLNKHKVKP